MGARPGFKKKKMSQDIKMLYSLCCWQNNLGFHIVVCEGSGFAFLIENIVV